MRQTAAIKNVAVLGGLVPSVATVYTGANGDAAIIEQRGALLRVTFAERNGGIIGHAELHWNPNVEAFDGTGTTIAACNHGPRQTSDAAIKFSQLFVVSAGIIRTRWLHPNKVDCIGGAVLASSWEEALWSAGR
jgi:hypothetical protein